MAIVSGLVDIVFLDFGNTLVHPEPDWMSHYLDVYEQVLGQRPNKDLAAQSVFDVWTNLWPEIESTCWTPSLAEDRTHRHWRETAIARRLGVTDPATQQQILHNLNRRFHSPGTFAVYPDVWPALTKLRQDNFRLAVLSNWDWDLPDLLAGLGLTAYFDYVIVSARVGCAKPNPLIFRQALQTGGIHTPKQAIHVGDNIVTDVQGAARAGLRPIFLDRDENFSTEDPAISNIIKITALTELPALLT